MSVYFPVDPDGFIYGAFGAAIQRKNNVSGGGWFYLGSDRTLYPLMTLGSTSANNHKLNKAGAEVGNYTLDATIDVSISGVELFPLNTWIFIGFSRTNDSLGHLYIKPVGGTKEYIQSTDVAGSWVSDEITAAVFGHVDLNLAGGILQYIDDCYMQDFFFADNTVLTEAQFDLLAALDDPRSIPGVTHHWLDETGDLAGALVDNVGDCPLALYDRLTATEGGTTTNPPVWNALALTLNAYAAPAVLTSPTVTAGATTATPTVSTTKAEGTIYAGVFSQGTVITDGQDIIDELTTQVNSLGSGVVTKVPTATGANELPQITGLSASTAYIAWFTQVDSDTNISTPVSFGFSTTASNSISATIVIDTAQTLHADSTSVSWELTEGVKSSAQTQVGAGDNASIVNGILTINTPTKNVGDKLILNADISTTDIHGTDTEHFRGSVTVE